MGVNAAAESVTGVSVSGQRTTLNSNYMEATNAALADLKASVAALQKKMDGQEEKQEIGLPARVASLENRCARLEASFSQVQFEVVKQALSKIVFYFKDNGAEPRDIALYNNQVDEVIRHLTENPRLQITIEGHCNSHFWSKDTDTVRSRERANVVRARIAHGFASSSQEIRQGLNERLGIDWKGNEMPAVKGTSPLNCRVIIIVREPIRV